MYLSTVSKIFNSMIKKSFLAITHVWRELIQSRWSNNYKVLKVLMQVDGIKQIPLFQMKYIVRQNHEILRFIGSFDFQTSLIN